MNLSTQPPSFSAAPESKAVLISPRECQASLLLPALQAIQPLEVPLVE